MAEKKRVYNVLVYFHKLGCYDGLGNIANSYAEYLSKLTLPDVHFIFAVPKEYKGKFGNVVDYVYYKDIEKELGKLGIRVDVVHYTDQFIKFRLRDKSVSSIFTVHDLNYHYEKTGIRRWKYRFMFNHRIKKVDVITTISKFSKADIIEKLSVGDKEVRVVYNGVENKRFSKRKRPSFIEDENKKFFFTVSQVLPKKNIEVLIPMMKYFPEYHLYICGQYYEGKGYYQELKRLISELPKENVSIIGKIEEEEKLWMYEHCSAFFFPSKLEGFGIPLVEAMQMGCCVFASRYTAVPEIGSKYVTYWNDYAPKTMAEVVKAKIYTWSKESEEAKAEIDYALGFSYDRYVNNYVSLYRELCCKE